MPDPWKALDERPHLQLLHAPIAERGRYYHRLRTIVLRTGMLLVEQRATLWHELVHADHGDGPGDCGNKREQRCEREAARRAIEIDDLVAALLWTTDEHELADELKTTVEQLRCRLDHLHPAERGLIRRALSRKEHPA